MDSILREGLSPNSLGIVYLTPKPNKWSPPNKVCLEVETGGLKLTSFEDCADWEVLCWGKIPPGYIRIIKYGRGKMNTHQINTLRSITIEHLNNCESLKPFFELYNINGADDILPTVKELHQELKYTPWGKSKDIQGIMFKKVIEKLALLIGCPAADASQLASEALIKQTPLINELNDKA